MADLDIPRIHSMLNGGVTGFCFELKLRKSSDDFFLVAMKENWRPSQNLCCSITGNSARRSNHTCTAKVRDNRLFGNYSAKSLELPLMCTVNRSEHYKF